ncbi:unnamed protein product, partial [Porites evermanni]
GTSERVYTYRGHFSEKHTVPMESAFSLDQIRRGDHICFPRLAYWHHAIVDTVDKSNGEVSVIEYSNSAKQFSQDNSSPPKNPGLAVVVRRRFKLENEPVYVIKHDRCFDPETVVSSAKSKLGERKYHPVTNNCEHFALWCKTGISSSEQVNNVKDAFKTRVNDVKDTLLRALLQEIVTETSVVKESVGGLEIAAVFEVVSAVYDISCAHKDKQEGRISQAEFDQAVGNRILSGTMNVAVSTAGEVIGQVLIPVPAIGKFVGGIVGSFIGKVLGEWTLS